jgi:hypothetical protein
VSLKLKETVKKVDEVNELKALMEHEKNNLRFYALFYDDLKTKLPLGKLENQINFHLDRLIDLIKQLDE